MAGLQKIGNNGSGKLDKLSSLAALTSDSERPAYVVSEGERRSYHRMHLSRAPPRLAGDGVGVAEAGTTCDDLGGGEFTFRAS